MSVLIGPSRLAELLAMTPGTLNYWEDAKFISATTTVSGKRYAVSDVDAILAAGARNMETAPTLDAIESKKVVFIKSERAAEILDLTIHGVQAVMRRGQIGGVKLLHEYRYDLASVLDYKAARNSDHNIPRPTVEHVLGVSRVTVNGLVAQGRLEDASDTYRRRITRASLLALIGDLAPDWIDPRDFLEDRLASDRPLLFARQVALTQTDIPKIRTLMDRGELHYINTPFANPNKDRLISPDSWLAYIERTETPFSDAQLARAFGVSRQTIANWRACYPGCLACPAHSHLDNSLYYTCVIILLRKYLPHGKGSSSLKWYRARIDQHVPVLTLQEAAEFLQISVTETLTLISRGELHGLLAPSDQWIFSQYAVIRTRDALSRQRKAAQSE